MTPCTAKKTFEIARETGNELIVQVKANQPGLLQRCEHIAATAAPIAVDDSRNLARNRQEDRRVEVYAPGAALDDDVWAPLIVPAHVHERADARVTIPMLPPARSLNVAIAAAMVLGEGLRQTAGFPPVTSAPETDGGGI